MRGKKMSNKKRRKLKYAEDNRIREEYLASLTEEEREKIRLENLETMNRIWEQSNKGSDCTIVDFDDETMEKIDGPLKENKE